MQEVFLVRDLGEMHPLAGRGPVGVAGRNLRQRHERDAAVAEVREADGIPGRVLVGRLAGQFVADVAGRRRDHRLDHVAGLRRPGRHGCRPDRRNRDADADGVDVFECRVALVFVDQDETARIGQALDVHHCIDALERRQDHRMHERQLVLLALVAVFVELGEVHLAVFHGGDLRVAGPLDVPVAKLRLHESPGIADAVETQVTGIGLGRHEVHRHPVANLALLEFGVEDERILVGGTEARRARGRADDHRARVFDQLFEVRPRVGRMAGLADRLRVAVVRTEAGHFLERELRPRRNHEIVVVDETAVVHFEPAVLRVQALDALAVETDTVFLHQVRQVDDDLPGLAHADSDPRVRRREFETLGVVDHHDVVRLPEFLAQFVCLRNAANAGTHNHYFRHDGSSLLSSSESILIYYSLIN